MGILINNQNNMEEVKKFWPLKLFVFGVIGAISPTMAFIAVALYGAFNIR